MRAAEKALLGHFSQLSTELYLLPPSQFMILGDEIMVVGVAPFKVSRPRFQQRSSSSADAKSETQVRKLFSNMRALRTRGVATFNLSKTYLKHLTALSDELKSTHVRFFNDDERGVVGRLFDVRVGSDLLLPRNKRIHAAATLETNTSTDAEFSVTLSIETLKKLPRDDVLVTVYEDGILEAEPVNGKFSESYLCRDQGIIEPFTSFQHDTLMRRVYFVHHPST